MNRAFRSLGNPNFRLWSAGSVVSNTGTWFQRIAQDWLVLTQLTDHSAFAVGLVMALQAVPTILLLPYTGAASDRMDRRRLLIVTQAGLALLALLLGILTLSHVITLWGVYLIAFLFGCITAFDAPARHTFVADLVGEREIANAVALNSASFNAGRLVGPAIAGLVIASSGIGWAFLINGVSFVAVLCSLIFLRQNEMHVQARARHVALQLSTGFRYIWQRSDLKTVLLMTFFVGTFGLNFPIFVSTMSAVVFHADAGRYGMLMSIMALGSLAGALIVARQSAPSVVSLMLSAGIFGVGLLVASLCPTIWSFGAVLAIVGGSAVAFSTATSSFMQMATEQPMRGRVASIRLAVGLGGTPIGAPIMGWLADQFGPRMSMGAGAISGFLAAAVAVRYLAKYRSTRGGPVAGDMPFSLQPSDAVTLLESAQSRANGE